LELPSDATVSLLKESIQAEVRIPKTSQHLYHNGRILDDETKTMEQVHIVDGDMLAVHVRDMVGNTGLPAQRQQQTVRPPVQRAGSNDAETIRLQLLGNPRLRQEVQRQQPALVAAIENPERFAQIYTEMHNQEAQERFRRQQAIAALNADPFDIDAQMKIAEMIREERVQENLQNAIEHNPEGMTVCLSIHYHMLTVPSFWSGAYALH
jgi:DNA damage-inducible protein 1